MPSETQPLCSIMVDASSGPVFLFIKCLFWKWKTFIEALKITRYTLYIWLKKLKTFYLSLQLVFWAVCMNLLGILHSFHAGEVTSWGNWGRPLFYWVHSMEEMTTHLVPVEGAVLNPNIYQCHLIWTKFQFSWVGDANIGWEISIIWNALGVFWYKWVCAQIH